MPRVLYISFFVTNDHSVELKQFNFGGCIVVIECTIDNKISAAESINSAGVGAAAEMFDVEVEGPGAVDGHGRQAALLVRTALPEVDAQDRESEEEEDGQQPDVLQRQHRVQHRRQDLLHALERVQGAQWTQQSECPQPFHEFVTQ